MPLLLEGDLPPIDQTALACTYAVALAPVPVAMALPRLEELFQVLERVHDSFTVTSHYSLSRLRLVESVVLTLASDEFTLGQRGHRWLEATQVTSFRRSPPRRPRGTCRAVRARGWECSAMTIPLGRCHRCSASPAWPTDKSNPAGRGSLLANST